MSSISKAFTIVGLLYNRKRVTIDELKEILDLSERSIYRYMNRLSSANIPVYYDPELQGYTVYDRKEKHYLKLCDNDLIILILSLKALESSLSGEFQDYLNRIKSNIFANSSFPLAKLKEFDQLIDQNSGMLNQDEFIDLIIHAALLFKTNVVIGRKASNSKNSYVLKNLKLRFKERWQLSGIKNHESHEVDKDDIGFIQLI